MGFIHWRVAASCIIPPPLTPSMRALHLSVQLWLDFSSTGMKRKRSPQVTNLPHLPLSARISVVLGPEKSKPREIHLILELECRGFMENFETILLTFLPTGGEPTSWLLSKAAIKQYRRPTQPLQHPQTGTMTATPSATPSSIREQAP